MWRSRILPTARTTIFRASWRVRSSERSVKDVGLLQDRVGRNVELHARRVDPEALEVVELAHRGVEDVGDERAEVEQRPAAAARAFLAEHVAAARLHGLADAIRDGLDLAVG